MIVINKERLTAFTDAILAIIMTILVLELEKPSVISLASLWELRNSFFAYSLSFFWLGTMWIDMHNGYEYVNKVSKKVVWNTLFLLFFSSFFPYVTSIVSTNFYNETAQLLYGSIVLLVTLFNIIMYKSLYEIKDNYTMKDFMESRKWIRIDVGVKVIGVLLSIFVYPPAVSYTVLLIILCFVPNVIKIYTKKD